MSPSFVLKEFGMLHQASGRWQLGLLLALVTAACWATLPVVLKITLKALDPITLTWFRFAFAAVFMIGWLGIRRQMAPYRGLQARHWRWLLLATVLLVGNYLGYLLGVQYTSPGNAQLLIQLAPLLMALGGIFVFKERFSQGQWFGLAIILLGLGLFFREQLQGLITGSSQYLLGSAFVGAAAISWASYALIQKQLLMRLDSSHILTVIYLLSALMLWPFAKTSSLLQLDGLQWALVLFCCANTLVAYGAFAEALAHWQASRVSAILATTPLLCLLAVAGVHALWPQAIAAEHVTGLGLFGAVLVMAGSTISSLSGQNNAQTKET
jgi:drug/metabolite transporter (DMT)-like permease